MVEQQQLLQAFCARTLNANGVQIIIGGEGPDDGLYDVSLVLSPYGIRAMRQRCVGRVWAYADALWPGHLRRALCGADAG